MLCLFFISCIQQLHIHLKRKFTHLLHCVVYHTGFSASNGLVVPISLVCRSPEILPQDMPLSLVLQTTGQDTTFESEEERITASAKEQILRFIKGLVNRDLLSETEADSLRNLLQESSSILFAAYSVALSSNDAAYMAEICRDLALSLQTAAGRLACEAQAEVFKVCDDLYSAGRVSENQLLYLRHLVLTREEGVAQVYDDYQNHLDVNTLGENLLYIANQVPAEENDDESAEDEEYDEDEDEFVDSTTQGTQGSAEAYSENSESGRAPVVPTSYDEEDENLKNTLTRVAALLRRGNDISYQQEAYLMELIEERNPYILDAFGGYEKRGDLDELKQSMKRIARTLHVEPDSMVPDAGDKSPSAMSQQEAYDAIANAKQELLKHSLDMLVKQNLTTQDDADSLMGRAKKGYTLVDAAIDQYAQDKDLPDFLETLSILANNSPEALDKIINSDSRDDYDHEASDDENDGDDDGLARPQLDLLGVISKLSEHQVIDEAQKLALVRLVNKKDNRIMTAYRDYTSNKNSNALIETVVALANIEVRRQRAAADAAGIEMVEKRASREALPKPPSGSGKSREVAPPAPPDATTEPTKLLDNEDQLEIIEILTMHKQLTESKAKLLHALVVKEDKLVRTIFSEYENTKDIRQLISKLQTIDVDDLRASESDDDDDLDDRESYDEEDDDESLEDEDRDTVEALFSNVVQRMRLSDLETAALRLAIAKNDPIITSAMETFRLSRDTQGLASNLTQIARKYVEEYDMEEEYGQNEDNDVGDEDDEYLRKLEEEAGYRKLGDEDDDSDEYSDDENDDLVQMQAREQIFPVLIDELSKENIITETDRGVLLNLFASNNSMLNSALDAYDVDNNLGQLVDTLRQVASRYNSRG